MTDNAEVTFGLLQTASSPEAGFYSLGEYAQERAISFPDLVISGDGFLVLRENLADTAILAGLAF